ncbi:hypothetical protein [Planotetraspora kaengkrachanensis]|uniref:CU044_5270 family protein n=1 Tax=Planotetraspora kaengkrachanensis TaxID=575193 RepID=A0A8J3PX66_9ACTN|nr:hypothetical protein [Planotetraspora kaengkrachanensis]GIG82521.1 hypothetical protein Pka01_56480 [Planotetraspora kaengkrachanensis]
MIVDEMDLVSQLKSAAPLRPETYERARMTLRGAMAESEPAQVQEMAPVTAAAPKRRGRLAGGRNRRLGMLSKVTIGAGIGALAAAAAIVVVAPSAPQPAAPAGSTSQAPTGNIKLVSLVTEIKASEGSLSGDASLVVNTQTIAGRSPYVLYSLYTDSGEYYVTDTQSALPGAIAGHDNLAEDVNAREVAAARAAATGDLDAARKQMINATPNPFGLGLSPAEQKAAWDKALAEEARILKQKGVTTPPKQPTGKDLQNLINNHLWINSVDALARGAANPKIRAGVLRLISTIPAVTVKDSTTDGKPTLTLTAGRALFQGSDVQVLTIDAKTGMPIRSEVGAPGKKASSVTTFESSRVTVADVKAGKF